MEEAAPLHLQLAAAELPVGAQQHVELEKAVFFLG
jgi:hypothetical protein